MPIDNRELSTNIEYKIESRNGELKTVAFSVDAMLDFYRMTFYRNLNYVLEYVGMTMTTFTKRMRHYNMRYAKFHITNLQTRKRLGMELYIVAAFCYDFGLPMNLVLNFDIQQRGIDLLDYGLVRNKYGNRHKTFDGLNREMRDSKPSSISKRLLNGAKGRANMPVGMVNFWSEYVRHSG